MAKIFITGSADGLGQMAAKLLVSLGHQVVLHARNKERGQQAMDKVPGAQDVLIADLSSILEIKKLAAEVNALGHFDAVIHNAGVYHTSNKLIFAVNSLAPYILTCMIQRPERLIYMSSGLHLQGNPDLLNLSTDTGQFNYSDSKLHILMLSLAVARKWSGVYSNAINPGWVATKMGGSGAPDDIEKGFETQVWLATSDNKQAKVSGRYFFHKNEQKYLAEAGNSLLQEKFLSLCEQISGVHFPSYE